MNFYLYFPRSDLGEMRCKRCAHNAVEYCEFHADLRKEGHTVLIDRSTVTFRHVPYGKECPVEACLTTIWRTSASLHSLTLHVIFLPISPPIHGQYSMLNEYRVTSLSNHPIPFITGSTPQFSRPTVALAFPRAARWYSRVPDGASYSPDQ